MDAVRGRLAHLRRERNELSADPEGVRAGGRQLGLSGAEFDARDAVAVRGNRQRCRNPVLVDVASGGRRCDADAVALDDEARVSGLDDPLPQPRAHGAGERLAIEDDGEPVLAGAQANRPRELRRRQRAAARAVVVDPDRSADVRVRRRRGAARGGVADRRRHLDPRHADGACAALDRGEERRRIEPQSVPARVNDRFRPDELDPGGDGRAAELRDGVEIACRGRSPARRDRRLVERERGSGAHRCVGRPLEVQPDEACPTDANRPPGRLDLDLLREPAVRRLADRRLDLAAVLPAEVDPQNPHSGLRLAPVGHHARAHRDRHGEHGDGEHRDSAPATIEGYFAGRTSWNRAPCGNASS